MQADAKGSLVLSEDTAVSFDGKEPVSAMDLFASCQVAVKKKMKLASGLKNIPLNPFYEIQIQVLKGQNLLGQESFKRYYQNPDISYRDLLFQRGQGRLFYSKASPKRPAIIVLSGSDGRIEKAQNIAQLLASHGFTTIAVAYFGLEGLSPYLERIPLELIGEVLDYLKESPYVDKQRIGMYGRSKGAEFALLAASRYSDIKCLVLNSPSHLCLEGIKKWRNSKTSSWTYKGREVSYHPFLWRDFFRRRFMKKPLRALDSHSFIPAANVQGALLLLASKSDEIWDAYQSVLEIKKQLQSKNFKYPYQTAFYENCGHMMTVAYQPNHRYQKIETGKVMADTNDSWRRTVAFFKKYLEEQL